ncbi:MAG: hypothetical protein E7241_03490 [Lachnospiraceae bacterium]|nr:hypothetical protein [Lachnospiraceae bacterium]
MKKIASMLLILAIIIGITGCDREPSEYMKSVENIPWETRQAEMLKYLKEKYPSYTFAVENFRAANFGPIIPSGYSGNPDGDELTVTTIVNGKEVTCEAERHLSEDYKVSSNNPNTNAVVIEDSFFGYLVEDEYTKWLSQVGKDFFADCWTTRRFLPSKLPNSLTEESTLKDLLALREDYDLGFSFEFCIDGNGLTKAEFEEKAQACGNRLKEIDLKHNHYTFKLIDADAYSKWRETNYYFELYDEDTISKYPDESVANKGSTSESSTSEGSDVTEYRSEYLKANQGVSKQARQNEMLEHLKKKYPSYAFTVRLFYNAEQSTGANEDLLRVSTNVNGKEIVCKVRRYLENKDSGSIIIRDNFFGYLIEDEYIKWLSQIVESFFNDCHVEISSIPDEYPDSLVEGNTLKDLLAYKSSTTGSAAVEAHYIKVYINASGLAKTDFWVKEEALYKELKEHDFKNKYDFYLVDANVYPEWKKIDYYFKLHDEDVISHTSEG